MPFNRREGGLLQCAGRRRVAAAWVAIGVGVMLLVVGLASCATARTVSLAQLVAGQEQLVGALVQTSGTVQEIADPDGTRYYVLDDGAGNRVALMPAEAVAEDAGHALTVTGTLENRQGFGRVLLVETTRRAR